MFLKNIFCENIFDENIFCENIFDKNIFGENVFDKNIFGENILDENIFGENIFGENIFVNNIFGKNIFFLPFLHLTSLQTTPTSSQLLVSDFWSWVWHNETNELTDRTHTHIVSFIVLDLEKM